MSSFVLRMAASPSRTTRWSSAINTLIFSMPGRLLLHEGDAHHHLRSPSFLRVDPRFPADQPRPLHDAADAEMVPLLRIARNGLHVEPDPVVRDCDGQQV